MDKYEQINYNELEELSAIGGMDDGGAVGTYSLTTWALITAISGVTTSASAVTVAWSALYSCTQNHVACDRG